MYPFRFCYCPTDRCNTAHQTCSLAPFLLLLPLIITASTSSFSFFHKTSLIVNLLFVLLLVMRTVLLVQPAHLMRQFLVRLKILTRSLLERVHHFLVLPICSVWLLVGAKDWRPHRTLS